MHNAKGSIGGENNLQKIDSKKSKMTIREGLWAVKIVIFLASALSGYCGYGFGKIAYRKHLKNKNISSCKTFDENAKGSCEIDVEKTKKQNVGVFIMMSVVFIIVSIYLGFLFYYSIAHPKKFAIKLAWWGIKLYF